MAGWILRSIFHHIYFFKLWFVLFFMDRVCGSCVEGDSLAPRKIDPDFRVSRCPMRCYPENVEEGIVIYPCVSNRSNGEC